MYRIKYLLYTENTNRPPVSNFLACARFEKGRLLTDEKQANNKKVERLLNYVFIFNYFLKL